MMDDSTHASSHSVATSVERHIMLVLLYALRLDAMMMSTVNASEGTHGAYYEKGREGSPTIYRYD